MNHVLKKPGLKNPCISYRKIRSISRQDLLIQTWKNIMVGVVGLEPTMHKAPDLQSGGFTSNPSPPIINRFLKELFNTMQTFRLHIKRKGQIFLLALS